MKLSVNGVEIDAAALLCGLYNKAAPYEKDQPQMTLRQARELVAGNGAHCDFDYVHGRAICMQTDPVTLVVRGELRYEAMNGKGTYAAAIALAQMLEASSGL